MKSTLVILMSCCLLIIFASCGNDGSSEMRSSGSDTLNKQEDNTLMARPANCPECDANVCSPACKSVVLTCHSITDSLFTEMTVGSGFSNTGIELKSISQIGQIVNRFNCKDHSILITGDTTRKQDNNDVKFFLIAVDRSKDSLVSVGYTMTLLDAIVNKEPAPSKILFFKGIRKDGSMQGDIVFRVETTHPDGTITRENYDISDSPPTQFEVVDITDIR